MAKVETSGKKIRNGKVNIGLWIGKETHERVIKIAEKDELNFSDIVRIALKEYIEKREV